jgi:hypothetical protein
MQQWRYKVISAPFGPGLDVEGTLNALGREGWEAIAFEHLDNNHFWVFLKQPINPFGVAEYVASGDAL